MQIILYKFSKKINSTAQPTSSTESLTLECLVKTPSSIISPAVQLSKGTEPIDYNYAYIADWGRYYFINDIEYSMGYWTLYLSVDVLASFKTGITSSSQYVLRSASSHDDSIMDNFYPAKGGAVCLSSTFNGSITRPDDSIAHSTSGYFSNSFSSGFFVIGIISNNATGISYYELTYNVFKTFIANLMAVDPTDMSEVSSGIRKAIYDPLQYIVSCKWFPITVKYGVVTQVTDIDVGGYAVHVGTATLLNDHRNIHLRTSASIPKHPDVSTFAYRQLSPYSEYKLIFEPFGTLALDTTKLYDASTLYLDWYFDVATGEAELIVSSNLNTNIANAISNIAVDVPVIQMTVDYIGGYGGFIGSALGTVGQALIGDAVGAISTALSGIGNTISAMTPNVTKSGVTGSFLSYSVGYPVLYLYYMTQVNPDNDRYGRPLCQTVQLSTLSGFCMCSNASISLPCTESERGTIESYLNSGVFIE